ncbi:MepB family protein [Paenibacillus wulumuqiensis]|uniref:MepB family protein n=1 Tax=Paenibacillus wulumuqiensis TaxID=1567107 RepID=UPI000696594A|nr:MepB family protein [Paenibacillus wulumuqiensis]
MDNHFASLQWIHSILLQANIPDITNLQIESQNAAYEGMTFEIDTHTFRSRLAKHTPKKKGYFVVFWEKDIDNNNRAYSDKECPDQVIVNVMDHDKQGQFIFPREILLKHGILRSGDQKGKMAMRVYPDWEDELNTAARRTQKWQLLYFINGIAAADSVDVRKRYLQL